jgi:hypothetical protein
MTTLALYDWYEREQVIALFGLASEARQVCNGEWLLSPNICRCLTTIGENASRFNAATKFVWVSAEPYHGGDPTAFVPSEARGANAQGRRLFLFVRYGTSPKYRYIGALSSARSIRHASCHANGYAEFDVSPALPSAIWSETGVFDPGDTNHGRIDAVLDRLRDQTSSAERMEVLQRLVEYWYGPIRPNDGFTDAELEGIRMPASLRNWYRWAGKRSEIMSGQNFLLMPKSDKTHQGLYVNDDRLVFYHENQYVYQWATLDDGDDPKVFGRYQDTDPWEQEEITVSEHLILACIFEGDLVLVQVWRQRSVAGEREGGRNYREDLSNSNRALAVDWANALLRQTRSLHEHLTQRRVQRRERHDSVDRRQDRTPPAIPQALRGRKLGVCGAITVVH